MRAAHLHDPRLHLRRPSDAGTTTASSCDQPTRPDPSRRVAAQPLVHRLTRNPVTAGHIGHRRPVVEHLQHSLIALLHHVQLHQHDSGLLRICRRQRPQRRRWPPAETRTPSVSQLPGPLSPRNRGRVPELSASYRGHDVHYEPGPHTRASWSTWRWCSQTAACTRTQGASTPAEQAEIEWSWGNRTPVHQPMNEPATTIPDFEADAASPAGRLVVIRYRWPPTPGLSLESAVFPAVSVLSHRHPPLLLPGCDGLAPCGISAHDFASTYLESGGVGELLIGGNSFWCPV